LKVREQSCQSTPENNRMSSSRFYGLRDTQA
jgi:hypothetical protein